MDSVNYLADLKLDQFAGSQGFREESLQAYLQMGLPNNKNENWKYTDLKFLENLSFQRGSFSEDVPKHSLLQQDEMGLLFLNGRLVHWQGLPKESVIVESEFGELPSQMLASDPFYHLNSAYCEAQVNINIPSGFRQEKPFYIVHLLKENGVVGFPRVSISVGEAVSLEIHEVYETAVSSSLYCPVHQVKVHKNGNVKCVQLQNDKGQGCHIHNVSSCLDKGAEVHHLVVASGAKCFRLNNHVEVGEEATAFMDGINVASDKQHCDFHVWADHRKERGVSHQNYKSILFNKSRFVFNGKISIDKKAQQVHSSQLNKNILMDSAAEVDTKPELEVYADDVTANHGATIGALSLKELFYLQSRGIPDLQARNLLLGAFVNEHMLKYKLTQSYMAQVLNEKVSQSLKQDSGFVQ